MKSQHRTCATAELAVGRTPPSAPDPLVRLSHHARNRARRGVGRGPGGPPHIPNSSTNLHGLLILDDTHIRNYSSRRVSAGCSFEIRSAGIRLAVAAIASNPSATELYVSGSVAVMPYIRWPSTRVARPSKRHPAQTPVAASQTPGSAASRIARATDEPSAMRMPSSLRRSATDCAIKP